MFQLYDPARGHAEPVRPARPGELRIWVAGGLRALVLADLIRRVAQRQHLRVTIWQQDAAATNGLNVYPAEFSGRPPDPFDLVIGQANEPGSGTPPRRMEPGPVRPEAPDVGGLDPLALRLALLEHPYREPAVLARDALGAADETLRRWRGLVAGWAAEPSKPVSARYVSDVLGALDDDLDTPAVLHALEALAADGGVPPGSRFETFAHLDQLVGLDLARDVGR